MPVAWLRFEDFASQASVAPSPTAGWGVAQNAIEFVQVAERPGAPASFWITLAGTSVGRGFQSVGHAPGVYRNRLTVGPAAPGDRPSPPRRPRDNTR